MNNPTNNDIDHPIDHSLRLSALLILPLTYLYVRIPFAEVQSAPYLFGLFTLGFLALGEYLYRDVERSPESWLFLLLTLFTALAVTFDLGKIWDGFSTGFLTHLYAVYWLLCRSGKLYYGRSSHLFLLDGINGFLLTPFGNYLLILKAYLSAIKGKKGQKKQTRDSSQIIAMLIAVCFGILLLVMALRLLISADSNFEHLLQMPDLHLFTLDSSEIVIFILTAIIAPYLYGLFAGASRKSPDQVRASALAIEKNLLAIKKIPAGLWLLFITVFSIFYVIFFLLQGSYMTGALHMMLPENYTFSEYARRGFAEMIGITFVNFMLLWLATRSSEREEKIKGGSLILTGETIIFILIASLKIFMYIQAYGWTPLRAQSIWLCGVLLFTCGCILYRLFEGRDISRFWFLTSASSLAILTLF